MNNPTRAVLSRGLKKIAVQVVDQGGWRSPISHTVGRVGALPGALMLGTPRGVFNTAGPSRVEDLASVYADEMEPKASKLEEQARKRSTLRKVLDYITGFTDARGQGELRVNTGGTAPLDNLKRVWRRPGIGLIGRLLGSAASPATDLATSLMRADHYNPFAHSATVFTDEPAVAAHELGHAKDFSRVNLPVPYALARNLLPVALWQEGRASQYGVQLLRKALAKRLKSKEPEDRELYGSDHINRILGGGMGSYVGGGIGRLLSLGPQAPVIGALVGQMAGYLGKPFDALAGDEKDAVLRAAQEYQNAESDAERKAIVARIRSLGLSRKKK